MSGLFLDELFNPPKLEAGDRVRSKNGGILGRKRGTVISSGGWFAVIQWDGNPHSRREYIPDLVIIEIS
jgi:hypothetical protein